MTSQQALAILAATECPMHVDVHFHGERGEQYEAVIRVWEAAGAEVERVVIGEGDPDGMTFETCTVAGVCLYGPYQRTPSDDLASATIEATDTVSLTDEGRAALEAA